MAYQNLAFRSSDRPRPQVTFGLAYGFTFQAYSSGTQVVPSSATITIRRPGGAAMTTPVSAASMSVSGGGDMTYTLTAGNSDFLGCNYTADIVYVVSGTSYYGRVLFDVVRQPLINLVITADLVKHHPDLADVYFSGDSSSAQVYIEQAHEDVFQYVDSRGKREFLIMSPEDLRRPIEHKALAKFFLPRVKQEGDRWDLYYKHHSQEFDNWIKAANFVYDEDQSGTADGTSDTDGISGEEGRGFQFRYEV